jgi:hypothetical protein
MTRVRSVPSRPWQLASSACAIAAAAGLAFIPTGSSGLSSQSAVVDSAGNIISTSTITNTITQITLFQAQGPSVLVILSIPVVLTLIGLLSPKGARQTTTLVSTIVLGLFVTAGMLTIGVFFLAALACSIVAIVLGQRPLPVPAPSNDIVSA